MLQNTKRQFTNWTKPKKTKNKYDNIQKDQIQIRQNTKWQNTNATKLKRQNINVTKHKKTDCKYE